MARKTFDLGPFVDRVNRMIAHAENRQAREALAVLVTDVLMESDQYRGFRYLPSELEGDGRLRDGYDDSRREYFSPTPSLVAQVLRG